MVIFSKEKFPALLLCTVIFLSAFSLFFIEPVIARFIVPRYGGSAEVWTACMLFFQLVLLAGYLWAHLLCRFFSIGSQVLIQSAVVLTAGFLTVPAKPALWINTDKIPPALGVIVILAVSVGSAAFILTSTGPLIQRWYNMAYPGKIPYRLYALSNTGSMLALVSYPFLFEPATTRNQQMIIWSWLWVLFAVLLITAGLVIYRYRKKDACPNRTEKIEPAAKDKPSWPRILLWMLLSAVAAVELLAVTNKMSLDLAVVPFLWILPLCIYLLTFIICFDRPGWYKRGFFIGVLAVSFVLAAYTKANELSLSPYFLIAVYSAVLFAVCMVCHGELYCIKPMPAYLTEYYLYIAAGGAVGGAFVSLAAPLIFDSYIELYIAMIVSLLLALRFYSKQIKTQKRMNLLTAIIGIILVFALVFEENKTIDNGYLIEAERNFFGVLSIWQHQEDDLKQSKRVMQNGTTFHGLQFINQEKQNKPTAYYGPKSGIGRLLESYNPPGRKIGAVGLGVGTIAAYLNHNDKLRFYEINPLVVKKAKQWFTYLKNAKGNVDIKTGDGRILLTQEAQNDYDILIIDAFSSDAIPVHLLTKEAFEVYLNNISQQGVIAVHVSTIHLDIQSVVMKAGQFFNLYCRWYVNDENPAEGIFAADWILLTRNEKVFQLKGLKGKERKFTRSLDDLSLWTDDHINLMEVIVSKDYHLR